MVGEFSAVRNGHGPADAYATVTTIEDLPSQTLASLRVDPTRNNQQRRIRFVANYEVGRVAIEGLRGPAGAG